MNTNNTERGGWHYATVYNERYRFQWDAVENEIDVVEWLDSDGDWQEEMESQMFMCLTVIYHDRQQERTAARDREAALAEMVAKWRERAEIARDAGDGMRAAQLIQCMKFADELEALLTNPTAHVEADRQGEVARQMYEALKITRDIMNFGPGHQISKACEAYEALHGTEGVRG